MTKLNSSSRAANHSSAERRAASPKETPGRAAAHCWNGGNGRAKRVLITGGAGFVGTNVAADLAGDGYEVHLLDNLSRPGVEGNLRWLRATFGDLIHLHRADIRDARAVEKAVARCGVVFHFAAQVAVTTSLKDPQLDFAVNGQGTLNLLEACRKLTTPPPLVFTSTNKVYGELRGVSLQREGTRYLPRDRATRRHGISECQPLDFHSPYGCSKGVADQYVLDYARCWDLPAVVFRMSCIYGVHQCGNEDQGWVAHFIRRGLDGTPITLFGDGCQVRDVLYVEDLVKAMAAAVHVIESARGRAFNIGGGPCNAVSLKDVLQLLAELHGSPPDVQREPWRQGDQRYYVSDTRAFTELTGWRPTTTVHDGVEKLYRWMRSAPARVSAAV